MGLLLLTVATLRWRYLDTPLERDEGEFAYGGQLILTGDLPYKSLYAMKLPGIYVVFALIEAVFGQTIRGIHWGLLVTSLINMVLVYLLARHWADAVTGWLAAAALAILTLTPGVGGTQAQAEHFVLPWALAGAWILSRWGRGWWSLLLAGLAFGVALVVKQHGGAYALFAFAFVALADPADWLRRPGRRLGELLVLGLGVGLPLAMTCLWIWSGGAWEPFVFWTIHYPRFYVGRISWSYGLVILSDELRFQWAWSRAIWCAAAVGLLVVLIRRRPHEWRFLLLWGIASILAISPGLLFRAHYFILLAPALAIFAAVGLRAVMAGLSRLGWGDWGIGAALSVVALGWPTWNIAQAMLPRTPAEFFNSMYTGFFVESPEFANYVAQHSQPDERIAVLGSEPQILFLAGRKSATPHVYMYPLMEPHAHAKKLQQELINDIERARPQWIIYTSDALSWGREDDTDSLLLNWTVDYLSKYYHLVGRAEQIGKSTRVIWNVDQLWEPPASPTQLTVYRRNSGI